MEEENLYCELFFDYNKELDDAVKLIARLVGGSVRPHHIIDSEIFDLDVNRNHDYKTPVEKQSRDPRDAFLYWKHYIDIDPKNSVRKADYMEAVGRLLQNLWAEGIDAVAACGFEDELPKH